MIPIVMERKKKKRTPLTPNEFVDVANGLLEGSIHREHLVEYKQKNDPHQSEYEQGRIGKGYYNTFMKRYKDKF